MKENGQYIIPSWCKDKCANSGTIACEYECAGERDARFFVADPEQSLHDIAPFPAHDWTWNMSAAERQAAAGLYLEKIVEAVTGVAQDPNDESRKKKLMESVNDESAWKLLTEMALWGEESE